MKELVIRIGKPTPLTSIFCVPENLDADLPAVLILNSGVMHHIGTCRVSVTIARELSRRGILSARFDFSGIGDSETRSGTKPFAESSVEEIQEVMDYLQSKKGIDQFIVYGLCSGADASYEIAKTDPRVVGMVQIDPYVYKVRSWYLYHYLPRLFDLGVWHRVFQKLTGRFTPTKRAREDVGEDFVEMPSYIRIFPPKEEVAKGLQQAADNDVAIYTILTAAVSYTVNRAQQYQQSFNEVNFKNLLTVEYHPTLEHILTNPEYQKVLPNRICDWMEQRALQCKKNTGKTILATAS